jgi:hypothetical protein
MNGRYFSAGACRSPHANSLSSSAEAGERLRQTFSIAIRCGLDHQDHFELVGPPLTALTPPEQLDHNHDGWRWWRNRA